MTKCQQKEVGWVQNWVHSGAPGCKWMHQAKSNRWIVGCSDSSLCSDVKKSRSPSIWKSGELIRVCMTSDFFLPEADAWRAEAWNIMYARPDVKFFLLTKRPKRVYETLPPDFGDGWENIFFNVTCENQRRADERIP